MKFLTSLSVCICLFITACSSNAPTYTTDYDTSADFTQFKTYRWYGDLYPSKEETFRSQNDSYIRIRSAIDDYLQQRGYQPSTSAKADFLVNYHLSTRENVRIDSFAGYPPGGGVHGSVATGTHGSAVSIGYSSKNAGIKTFKEGTAVIDIVSTAKSSVVWRGIAEGRLSNKVDLKQRRQTTKEVVKELLSQFPPQ